MMNSPPVTPLAGSAAFGRKAPEDRSVDQFSPMPAGKGAVAVQSARFRRSPRPRLIAPTTCRHQPNTGMPESLRMMRLRP